MIDFKGMGLRQGFSDALAIQANGADDAMHRANQIIADKNARIGELKGEIEDLGGQVATLGARLEAERRDHETARTLREAQWTDFLATVREEHRVAMVVAGVRHEAAGLLVAEISDELDAAASGNAWSSPTGLSYPDGTPQKGRDAYSDLAFDALLERKGIPDPVRYRLVASGAPNAGEPSPPKT